VKIGFAEAVYSREGYRYEVVWGEVQGDRWAACLLCVPRPRFERLRHSDVEPFEIVGQGCGNSRAASARRLLSDLEIVFGRDHAARFAVRSSAPVGYAEMEGTLSLRKLFSRGSHAGKSVRG